MKKIVFLASLAIMSESVFSMMPEEDFDQRYRWNLVEFFGNNGESIRNVMKKMISNFYGKIVIQESEALESLSRGGNFPRLEMLSIIGDDLAKLSRADIAGLSFPRLDTLNMSELNNDSWDQANDLISKVFSTLESLELRYIVNEDKIDEISIPDSIWNCRNLMKLRIRGGYNIVRLSEEIGNLQNLTILNLFENK